MDLHELAEIVGYEKLITELENWMPTDELEEFIRDVEKDYDLD